MALHCGNSPHGLAVIDPATMEIRQQVPLKSAWLGLAWSTDKHSLYVGSAKGLGRYANVRGPTSPLAQKGTGDAQWGAGSHLARIQRGSVVLLTGLKTDIKAHTRRAMANSPYNDEMLARARPPQSGPSIVPRDVGAGSPIKHVIYIIKENRTYDQVFGDLLRLRPHADVVVEPGDLEERARRTQRNAAADQPFSFSVLKRRRFEYFQKDRPP